MIITKTYSLNEKGIGWLQRFIFEHYDGLEINDYFDHDKGIVYLKDEDTGERVVQMLDKGTTTDNFAKREDWFRNKIIELEKEDN